MIERAQVKKLAELARIEVSDEEAAVLEGDLESILTYVSKIKEAVSGIPEKAAGDLRNVMREDGNPHAKGMFTKDIMKEVPEQENGYVKVKQILP